MKKKKVILIHEHKHTMIKESITAIFHALLHVLLPRFCPICGRRLTASEPCMCIGCLSMMPLIRMKDSKDNRMVRSLWSDVDVEHGISLIYYRSHTPHNKLVLQFKYHEDVRLALELGRLAATMPIMYNLGKDVDIVIPVPLSKKRRRERGYNQAEWLARGVAETYGLPVRCDILKRVEHRSLQTGLNEKERRKNVKGLYRARVPMDMEGKHFLLVDDVCTTGSTLGACAKAILSSAPNARISIFTLAWSGE